MTAPARSRQRLFVLDSNVLIHDPTCLYRFQEHDVFLPMMVLEELDNNKRGHSDVARSARQASRFLEEHVRDATRQEIEDGLPLPQPVDAAYKSGRLYIQTQEYNFQLPDSLPGSKADNTILSTVMALQQHAGPREVILVSKDINLRIKAAALGIKAEDYHNDQVLDDVNLLYSGSYKLEPDFWDTHGKTLESWVDDGRTFYRVSGERVAQWYPCQFLYDDDAFEAMVRSIDNKSAVIELIDDYRSASKPVWGINARNREQNFALHALMDPTIDFVTLVGAAGTGKTLLTLAAALSQTLDQPRYQETIMTPCRTLT